MPLETEARSNIDRLLEAAGWCVFDVAQTNIHAARGVAIREFPLKSGHGFADYLLYVDGKAAGVIEAKKEGVTLTGVEIQAAKYTQGLPDGLPRWGNPLLEGEGIGSIGRWRAYDYEELANRDKASLDIFWLRDESLSDSDNLPAPEVIAAEIVEDLEAALEQFREILADIGPEVREAAE